MKALLFFLILGLSIPLCAQFLQNDFSNADLSDWQGDLTKFAVADNQLQLLDGNPGSSNTAYLSLPAPTNISETTTWECWVKLDFSPSAGNFARIYLSAAQADLNAAQEGYYLQIGGISGAEDAIELYRQDGSDRTLLLAGTAGAVGGSTVLAKIRVSRTETGVWSFAADYTGGDNFQAQGDTITDATYPLGRYFGLYCQYSATRSDAFFFDDILIDPLFVDQAAPILLSATPLDQNNLSVRFDEALDAGISANSGLYQLSNGLSNPAYAQRSAADPTVMELQWAQGFSNLSTYTLTVDGVADDAGNVSGAQSIDFTYRKIGFPQAGELLVTEMMVDPSPTVGLPDAEYLELYNAGTKVLELEGVGISTGSSPKLLPAFQLLPKAYILLVDAADAADFVAFGPTIAISSLPALTNGADQLMLTDKEGAPLVDISYDLSWYRDAAKADGGWSLEVIDPQQALDCPGNWSASAAPMGGTPGVENSVNGNVLETDGPVLLSAYAETDLEIILRFDEALDPTAAADPSTYTISAGTAITAAFPQAGKREVLLTLSTPLQPGTVYEVQANVGLSDCLGNPVSDPVSRRVGLAEPAAAGDIVINELLFFPKVHGVDFIELYNRSDKTVNLRDWRINNLQADTTDSSTDIITDFLIFPGEYVVITEVPQDIQDRYTVPFPERLLANELPTLGDEGQLTLTTETFIQTDSFAYSADLHSPLLNDERGVSLERVDTETPTNSPGNWHSAAGTVGFATPTDQNSQYFPIRNTGSNVINLVQKRFSPDGDGFEDLLLLQVETDRPGYLASIQVFDANGRLVHRLLRNELLPNEGVYKWDGTHDDGHKARIGIYVILLELVHPDGTVVRWQESCVLAGQLE